jgi:hypothetical protein
VLPADARLMVGARPEASSPATGYYATHQAQEQDLIERSLLEPTAPGPSRPARGRVTRGASR